MKNNEDFKKHLEKASKIVDKWPSWKRSILGGEASDESTKQEKRPNWVEFWLEMAYVYSSRSHDKNTKHGCILVRKNNTIASTGYNGFPPGSNDNILPCDKTVIGGEEKYEYINHAEENAILIAAKTGTNINECVAYVTGIPCSRCSRMLVSVGITEWHCGDTKQSSLYCEKQIKIRNNLLRQHNVKVHLYGDYDEDDVKKLNENGSTIFTYHENFY